jgi:hypothetical protein
MWNSPVLFSVIDTEMDNAHIRNQRCGCEHDKKIIYAFVPRFYLTQIKCAMFVLGIVLLLLYET